jgi:hypothetical protein
LIICIPNKKKPSRSNLKWWRGRERERESATTDSRERTSIVGTYNRERKRDEMMRFMGKDG